MQIAQPTDCRSVFTDSWGSERVSAVRCATRGRICHKRSRAFAWSLLRHGHNTPLSRILTDKPTAKRLY